MPQEASMKPAFRTFEAPVVWWVVLTSSMHWSKANRRNQMGSGHRIRGPLQLTTSINLWYNWDGLKSNLREITCDEHPAFRYVDVQQGCRIRSIPISIFIIYIYICIHNIYIYIYLFIYSFIYLFIYLYSYRKSTSKSKSKPTYCNLILSNSIDLQICINKKSALYRF